MPAAHCTIPAYGKDSFGATLETERITTVGAPAARAHIHHIFFFILRFSSSPRVNAKPSTATLTSEARRNGNAHTFCTFCMLPMLVRELTEPRPNEPNGDGETDEIVQFHNVSVAHNGTFDGSEKSSLGTFLDTTVGWLHRGQAASAFCRHFRTRSRW